MPKNYQYYCQQNITKQNTRHNQITSLNIDCRYKSAESMLSQKREYTVNFISKYLGLVVDAKKIIKNIANRLLHNKRLVKIRLFHKTLNADTSLLSQC